MRRAFFYFPHKEKNTMTLVDKAIEFLKDRKGDEFAQKAVILILIVIAGVSAVGYLGSVIVRMINNGANGLGG